MVVIVRPPPSAGLQDELFCFCGKCVDKFREEFHMLPPVAGQGYDMDYYKATITPWVFGSRHSFPSGQSSSQTHSTAVSAER